MTVFVAASIAATRLAGPRATKASLPSELNRMPAAPGLVELGLLVALGHQHEVVEAVGLLEYFQEFVKALQRLRRG